MLHPVLRGRLRVHASLYTSHRKISGNMRLPHRLWTIFDTRLICETENALVVLLHLVRRCIPISKTIFPYLKWMEDRKDWMYRKRVVAKRCLCGVEKVRASVLSREVEPLVFYVHTTFRDGGYRPVGYFSRQMQFVSNNFSCICVFPCYHRRGGTFLVDFICITILLSTFNFGDTMSGLLGIENGLERPLSEQRSCLWQVLARKTDSANQFESEEGSLRGFFFKNRWSDKARAVSESRREHRKIAIVRDRREAEKKVTRYIEERAKPTLLATNDLVVTSFKERLIEEATVGWASLNKSFQWCQQIYLRETLIYCESLLFCWFLTV
ncbi:hypothetical protein KIN20_023989 [Parelaphostrongylus tenuis]|uniref:Histone acetyltransferase n=1 Tax=Parelaphostrongylus tenuis TaxID=148309 RepID=A0AAD5N9M8_PARTN|nr:hypothetical protein KIN20_023989 [Parelaphostrongylus tenuis]